MGSWHNLSDLARLFFLLVFFRVSLDGLSERGILVVWVILILRRPRSFDLAQSTYQTGGGERGREEATNDLRRVWWKIFSARGFYAPPDLEEKVMARNART